MTRVEFIKKVANDTNSSYTRTEKWVNAVLDSLADAIITEDELRIQRFGTFEHVARKARKGRNASTGETILIPAKTGIKFTPALAISEEVKDIPVVED